MSSVRAAKVCRRSWMRGPRPCLLYRWAVRNPICWQTTGEDDMPASEHFANDSLSQAVSTAN